MHIREDDLTGPQIIALLHEHLKNMHEITPPGSIHALDVDRLRAHRRQGIASRILEHIIEVARQRGYTHLYLETGAFPAFAPARALYERYGFEYRGPFGDYTDDSNSSFMEKKLLS